MKPNWADQKVYDLFDEFITTCILNDDSLLTTEKDIFTIDAINDNIERFITNVIEGNDSYDNKITKQFLNAPYPTRLVFAHVNWLWALGPSDITEWYKREIPKKILGDEYNGKLREDVYPSGGFGSAGLWHRQNKPVEIAFIILLCKQLKINVLNGVINNLAEAKINLEKICLECRFNWYNDDSVIVDPNIWEIIPEGMLAMYNILLHLSNPSAYEPIASEGHKNRVFQAFHRLIDDAPQEIKEGNREAKILYIRNEISKYWGNTEFTFYDKQLYDIWNFNLGENDFNEFQALQYKKAIVMYGPPGTSKTHSAKALARTIIYQHYFAQPENVKEYFKSNPDISSNRIHRLQLHTNYNYEDFIAGVQLVDGKTQPTKGYLLNLIELINQDQYPHILILDEINRVDLSRLFGEFFSGLENRGESIPLSIGGFQLNVPSNLYVIGTMNEIDFSLERIDFALRRRFVWFFYGFKANILKEILMSKQHKFSTNIKDEDLDIFISKAQKLNDQIFSMDELGKQYEIGHTFFGEIIDIYGSYRDIEGQPRLKLFKKGGPVKVLWDISIKPMLEAFLGNMDRRMLNEKIIEFEDTFLK